MDTVIVTLHLLAAVFIVGPMAVLPHSAMRAIRNGDARHVSSIARLTTVFGALSLLAVVFGFGAMSLAPASDHVSIATPWIWISIVLWAVATAVALLLVAPRIRSAGETIAAGGAVSASPAIPAGAGIVTILLMAVVVLMVVKP